MNTLLFVNVTNGFSENLFLVAFLTASTFTNNTATTHFITSTLTNNTATTDVTTSTFTNGTATTRVTTVFLLLLLLLLM